jgi:hypothetical protein
MKQSHIMFNIVGLIIAMICAISGCGKIEMHGHESSLLWTGLIMLLVEGGGFANLVRRRLTPGPTITMITGYCISVLLIPLAIWGIVLLVIERNRKRRRRW